MEEEVSKEKERKSKKVQEEVEDPTLPPVNQTNKEKGRIRKKKEPNVAQNPDKTDPNRRRRKTCKQPNTNKPQKRKKEEKEEEKKVS